MPTIHIPGISPVNKSGSGFTVVELNGDVISKVTNYYFDLGKAGKDASKKYDTYWRKFDFSEKFKMTNFSPLSIFNAYMDKVNEKELLEFYSGFDTDKNTADEMADLSQVKLDESKLSKGKNDSNNILKYKKCAQMIYLQNQVESICNKVMGEDLSIVKKAKK